MTIDLLTSSCEIVMDRQQLQYEDALPVPQTADMVISALDGIYLMKGSSSSSSSITQKLILLYGKSFPVRNMYYFAGELFIYSSVQQIVWKLIQQKNPTQAEYNDDDQNKHNSLSVVLNLSSVLRPGDIRVEEGSDGGILIFRDSNTMLVSDITKNGGNAVIAQCVFPMAFDSSCNFQSKTREYVYMTCSKSYNFFKVYPTIMFGSNSSSSSSSNNKNTCLWGSSKARLYIGSNIWQDVVTSLRDTTIMDMFIVPGFYSKFDPVLKDSKGSVINPNPVVVRGQINGDLIVETTDSSPRRLFDKKNINLIFRMIGDELDILFTYMTGDQNNTCGPVMCVLDRPVGYDAMGTSPYSRVSDKSKTWMDVLQGLINKEIAQKLLNNNNNNDNNNPTTATNSSKKGTLGDLRDFNGSANYQKLIEEFSDIYRASISSRLVLKLFLHPKTNNLWMVREDSLHEISRSGVQVHADNGLCLPSYIAMCPVCFWAESGAACRPCTVNEVTSAAWILSCNLLCQSLSWKPTTTTTTTTGRRLLLAQSSGADSSSSSSGSVVFVLTSNNATTTNILKTVWPNASFTVWNGTEISVVLKSDDIQATIASAVVKLNSLPKIITILVPPYGIATTSTSTSSSSSATSIVFVIDGSDHNTTKLLKTLQKQLPSGSSIVVVVPGDRNTTVTISTSNDPRDDMWSVKQVLAENLDLSLLVNPYLRVDMLQINTQDRRSSSSSSGTDGKDDLENDADNNWLVIALVVCSVVVCVGIAAAVYFKSKVKRNNNNTIGTSMVQRSGAGCEYTCMDNYNTFHNIRIVTGVTPPPST